MVTILSRRDPGYRPGWGPQRQSIECLLADLQWGLVESDRLKAECDRALRELHEAVAELKGVGEGPTRRNATYVPLDHAILIDLRD